ncbi:hypothetical protein GW17_00061600 [Ensete ventricosum]|nr:hypothetical protein GW17_00061600 [Ensete ventricosum]
MERFLPSDEILAAVVPVVVYWVYSGVYVMLGSVDRYRLHSRKDEDVKNLVSKRDVVIGVLLQQLVQVAVAVLTFKVVAVVVVAHRLTPWSVRVVFMASWVLFL